MAFALVMLCVMYPQFGLPATINQLDEDGKQTLSEAFSADSSGMLHSPQLQIGFQQPLCVALPH
jgi:hypothetical protein